jgi:hypothetical protein
MLLSKIIPPLRETIACVLPLTELQWECLHIQPGSDPGTEPAPICCVCHYTALYPGASVTENKDDSNSVVIKSTVFWYMIPNSAGAKVM